MSNTRKRRQARPTPRAPLDSAPPRCECRHSYEPGGRCTRPATLRAIIVCEVEGCDCAAGMSLGCAHCASLWRVAAEHDGVELRFLAL